MTKIQGSEYINSQRKDYSLYVLQNRAIPHMADGLKASARRVMWIARDGKKWKSANLAGACMPLHPHAAPEDAVNTLAAHYGNNNALLDGIGSFGTRLEPTEYGASRYTSVKASDFAKDAFYTDIEIIPMKLNYDNTLEEPVHFLPLVPVAFLNPTSGIAIGFACDIFSRSLKDIIDCQIKILQGTIPKKEPFVQFIPLKCTAVEKTEDYRWVFK
jgi:DNA topoisomerase-2